MKENKIEFYFYSKFSRVISYIPLLVIIVLPMILFYNFNIFALIGIVVLDLFVIFLCYFYNRYRIIIDESKITCYSFKKHELSINKITSVELSKDGCIKIKYNNKIFTFAGCMEWYSCVPNKEKNQELVDLIKSKIKLK